MLAIGVIHAQTSHQYVDEFDTMNLNANLKLNYSTPLTGIGSGVAIWSDYAAVSASHTVANYNTFRSQGIIYLYKRNSAATSVLNTWVDTGSRYASNVADDGYGSCISLGSNVMAVGAPTDSQNGEKNGAAYIHFGTNLQSRVILTPGGDGEQSYIHFGSTVAATTVNKFGSNENSFVLVGAYGHGDDGKTNSGMVYVYAKTYSTYGGFTWTLVIKLQPSVAEASSLFGMSVSACGDLAAVGAPGVDKVYVYQLRHKDEPDHNEQDEREREEREREEHEKDEKEHHRALRFLQEDKDHEHEEDQKRQEEERRQEEEKKEEQLDSEWEYQEVLVVTSDQGYNSDRGGYLKLNFGSSVSCHNSSVPSIAIGASNDGLTSATGAVYIITLLNKNHLYSQWYPDTFYIPNTRRLQGGEPDNHYENDREEREKEEREKEEKEREESEHRGTEWNLFSYPYMADKAENYWLLEHSSAGTKPDQRYGSRVSMSGGTLAVGSGITYPGKVDVYSRVKSSSGNTWANIVLRGPLYDSEWQTTSSIYDPNSDSIDKFASAMQLSFDTLIVGSPQMKSGTGTCYLYSTRAVESSGDQGSDNTGATGDGSSGDDNNSGQGASNNGGNTASASHGSSSSLAPLLERMVLGVIVVAAVVGVYARIRYHFTKPQKKKKKGKKGSGGVNSLNDLDSSTTSRHGLLDTSTSSVGSSVHSHVQMAPYSGQLAPPPPPPPRPHERGRAGGGRGGRGPLTHPSRQMLPQAQRPRGGQPPPPGMHPGSSHGLQHGYAAQDRAEYYDNSQPYHHEQRHPSMHGDGMGGSRSGKSQRLSQGGRLSSSQHGAAMYSS